MAERGSGGRCVMTTVELDNLARECLETQSRSLSEMFAVQIADSEWIVFRRPLVDKTAEGTISYTWHSSAEGAESEIRRQAMLDVVKFMVDKPSERFELIGTLNYTEDGDWRATLSLLPEGGCAVYRKT
jgi:hypothetical protein